MENLVRFGETDIAAVWGQLDERTQLAIYCKVLEGRVVNLEATVAQRDEVIDGMRHQIELLEQAVKEPQMNYDGVKVA